MAEKEDLIRGGDADARGDGDEGEVDREGEDLAFGQPSNTLQATGHK